MKIENIALGIWMPRASIHLKEIYQFLEGKKTPVQGLDEKQLAKFRAGLKIEDVRFVKEREADFVRLTCHKAAATISEEGIIVLTLKNPGDSSFSMENIAPLENFFMEKFSPALKYLFSLGAPLPKELKDIREAYPAIIIIKDSFLEEIGAFIKAEHLEMYSKNTSEHLDFYLGEEISILHVKNNSVALDTFLEDIIFFKEFSLQLKNWLTLHRTIWNAIDQIRKPNVIAYKNLPRFRESIDGFLKTLSMTKARIRQMDDIIVTRKNIRNGMSTETLDALKMNRIDNLTGDIKYIEDLWEMTIDYAKNTLQLIESLSQENIRRELNALKFVTLIAAVTSFFGMNIAFPWEERWPQTMQSSFIVVGIIILLLIMFYYFLKIFVYQRKFKLR